MGYFNLGILIEKPFSFRSNLITLLQSPLALLVKMNSERDCRLPNIIVIGLDQKLNGFSVKIKVSA